MAKSRLQIRAEVLEDSIREYKQYIAQAMDSDNWEYNASHISGLCAKLGEYVAAYKEVMVLIQIAEEDK